MVTARRTRKRKVAETPTAEPKPKAAARTRRTTKTVAKVEGSGSGKATTTRSGSGYAGFRADTAADVACRALVAGGDSKIAIMHALREEDQKVNGKNGLSANWSVTMSAARTALLADGWTETGTYRMIPPADYDGDVQIAPGEAVYMPINDPDKTRRKGAVGRPRTTRPKNDGPIKAKKEDDEAEPAVAAPVRKRRAGRRPAKKA